MRSDAKFSYEMSVNGQTLHKDYLDAHIQQGNEGQTVISSGTKLLYELKPDCEAESGPLNNIDNTQEFSPLKCKEAYPSGTKTQQVETSIRSIFGNGISGEAHDNHYVQINSSKEAIDFIGSFLTHPICTLKNSTINCTGKFDLSPQLDLSLRRSRPISFENELTEERHTLMHSNASAFKRIRHKRIREGRLQKVYNQLKAGKYKVENANVKIGEMEKGDYLHQVHVEDASTMILILFGSLFLLCDSVLCLCDCVFCFCTWCLAIFLHPLMATLVTGGGGDPNPPHSSVAPPVHPALEKTNLNHTIIEMLDSTNYLFYMSQVELVIRGYNLLHFIHEVQILQRFATIGDANVGRVTEVFKLRDQ
ncbi:hypothetical protein JHK87_043018 [Glycine soja]|nr:hypothetical protein JHK87_043018 [Glycine soja]